MIYTKKDVIEILENLKVYEKLVWDVKNNDTKAIDGYKAIRMKRSDDLVRIVSPDYSVIQHIDAFNQTIEDLDKLNLTYVIREVYLNDFATRNNKRRNSFQVTFEFPELSFNVDGSPINATLELMNSNDTSLMFTRKFGAYRAAGNSIMNTGKKLFYERFKHVGENTFGDMADAVEHLPEFLKIFSKVIAKTMLVRTDNAITRGLTELGFPSRLIDNLEIANEKYSDLVGEKASPDQLWGVYKILTNWLTNVVAKTNLERADRLGNALYRFVQMKIIGI